MKFWFRGHHYGTSFLFALKTRLSKWFGSYKYPTTSWLDTHIDNCCDYWEDVGTEKAMRAFALDDDLGFDRPSNDTQVSDLVKENPDDK